MGPNSQLRLYGKRAKKKQSQWKKHISPEPRTKGTHPDSETRAKEKSAPEQLKQPIPEQKIFTLVFP